MSLVGVAKENQAIFARGTYQTPAGRTVDLAEPLARAVAGTRLYRPADPVSPAGVGPLRIEVTAETTGAALRRLVEREGAPDVAALNFASAKNPGGGFLTGAKAQEEDLARCSGLYPCLTGQSEYYQANRAIESLLYTDHVIHSPDVPFFRGEDLGLLEAPFLASLITAPAPNAGEVLRRQPDARPAIRATLAARAARILAIAADRRHPCLVLGAWGCGVFRNDPVEVAEVFATALAKEDAFRRVVFAVYDRSREQRTLRAFRDRFGA